jgi:hypothetical protein
MYWNFVAIDGVIKNQGDILFVPLEKSIPSYMDIFPPQTYLSQILMIHHIKTFTPSQKNHSYKWGLLLNGLYCRAGRDDKRDLKAPDRHLIHSSNHNLSSMNCKWTCS